VNAQSSPHSKAMQLLDYNQNTITLHSLPCFCKLQLLSNCRTVSISIQNRVGNHTL